ncbi:sulfate/molybdate ABC transporter ATP-binding protein [Virgibacillus necropolis]|uniref:ABC transporter n=1 Tax=Virgibacillus necropolis TaxID=163877 RepID=A0A221M852_9BACI|nr:ATP-binding cassette domain-containing protein [Virgibacillus necropolis]ASN03814.1 ABC transporter [Virgibacillus necropolis]
MLTVDITKRLKNFSLNIQFNVGNEIVVLFGPSGSGKTTLLNCIAGLARPDSGAIKLNDRFLYQNEKPMSVQKRNIGYLFQEYALFPHMTVEKNIRYGMKDAALVENLVDVVGIRSLMDSYPRQISGGEKQRVALIRALAMKPDALLLDEPFSSLDEKTRIECQDELIRLHNTWNIPIIMVTHNYDEATKVGNRIIKMKSGKTVQVI